MKAIKLKMKPNHQNSLSLTEIDSIYLSGCKDPGPYKKEVLHDYLQNNPGAIQVDIYPYPDVVPACSPNGEKYVKSKPNENGFDNLLRLPRE